MEERGSSLPLYASSEAALSGHKRIFRAPISDKVNKLKGLYWDSYRKRQRGTPFALVNTDFGELFPAAEAGL